MASPGRRMSTKNGRKHRRRTDDEDMIPQEFKTPANKKHFPPSIIVEKQELSVKNNIQEPVQHIDLTADDGAVAAVVADIADPLADAIVEQAAPEANGNGNGTGHSGEPFNEFPVDNEEVEIELQFDENSDVDSVKDSPQLSPRCATRRSQTRNIPTPKTPRSFSEFNGEEKEENGDSAKDSDKASDVSEKPAPNSGAVTPVQTEESPQASTPVPSIAITETDAECKENQELPDNLNVSVESTVSTASTKVNVGSDITREADLTLPADNDSFMTTAKDMSVVESLRRISSRRGIRSGVQDYRKTLLKSQTESYVQRIALEKQQGQKRKTRSQTPEDTKRFKTANESAGILSYLTSPVHKIRNLFGTSAAAAAAASEAVSASTPKLTSYKQQELVEDPEISKIEEDSQKGAETKKSCVVM